MYIQNKNRLTAIENKLMVTKEERCGEGQIRRTGLTDKTIIHEID